MPPRCHSSRPGAARGGGFRRERRARPGARACRRRSRRPCAARRSPARRRWPRAAAAPAAWRCPPGCPAGSRNVVSRRRPAGRARWWRR
ncbi:MAG: hypothetical protein EOP73_26695 [Variovorax sp.]|nr:MAG: hypothetical protein EOP73_26695 [Variovorax sp.]